MKKNEVKISENGIKYYVNENGVKVILWEGEKYTFYPFVDCDPEMQNEVIAYLKETQPSMFKNQFFFYNVFLPNYQVILRVVSDNKDDGAKSLEIEWDLLQMEQILDSFGKDTAFAVKLNEGNNGDNTRNHHRTQQQNMNQFLPFARQEGHIHRQHDADGTAGQHRQHTYQNRIVDNSDLVFVAEIALEHIEAIAAFCGQRLQEGANKR